MPRCTSDSRRGLFHLPIPINATVLRRIEFGHWSERRARRMFAIRAQYGTFFKRISVYNTRRTGHMVDIAQVKPFRPCQTRGGAPPTPLLSPTLPGPRAPTDRW